MKKKANMQTAKDNEKRKKCSYMDFSFNITYFNFEFYPLTAITVLLNDLPVVPLLNHRWDSKKIEPNHLFGFFSSDVPLTVTTLLLYRSVVPLLFIIICYYCIFLMDYCFTILYFFIPFLFENFISTKRIELERKVKRTVEDNQQNIRKRIKLERKGKRTVEDNQQNIRLGKELDKMEKTKRSRESNS
uniref:Uncharacterized protein n=1 Tax=Oryza nivara TaxID=4536 RepID=A0A0E0FRA9_ORYNI